MCFFFNEQFKVVELMLALNKNSRRITKCLLSASSVLEAVMLLYYMRKSNVVGKCVRVMHDMYNNSKTVARCAVRMTMGF